MPAEAIVDNFDFGLSATEIVEGVLNYAKNPHRT